MFLQMEQFSLAHQVKGIVGTEVIYGVALAKNKHGIAMPKLMQMRKLMVEIIHFGPNVYVNRQHKGNVCHEHRSWLDYSGAQRK